jgi:hypothetical protein
MTKYYIIRKLTDLLYFNCIKKVDLFVSYILSRVFPRLTLTIANAIHRFKMQEKFFCFECGMYLPEYEMRNTIGAWFGVCRLCTGACDHLTEFRKKF